MVNRNRQRGFNLLEVLVAFAIAAAALSVLLKGFSSGFQLSKTSEEYSRATVIAESLLARVGPEFSVDESPYTGQVGSSFYWQVELSPYPIDEALKAGQQAAKLINISVNVRWSEGFKERDYSLTGLRLLPNNAL